MKSHIPTLTHKALYVNTPTLLTHRAHHMGLLTTPHKGQALSHLSLHWLLPLPRDSLPHLPQVSDQMSTKIYPLPQLLPSTSSQAPPTMASLFCLFPFTRAGSTCGLFCSLLWPHGPAQPGHTVGTQCLLNDSFSPAKWDYEETRNVRSNSGGAVRMGRKWVLGKNPGLLDRAHPHPLQTPSHQARPRLWWGGTS